MEYQKAYDIAYSQCFASKGKTYTKQNYSLTGTRIYGMWNVPYAEKYGYSAPGAPADGIQYDTNDAETMSACGETVGFLKEFDLMTDENEEFVMNLSASAYTAAMNNPEWKEARQAWWTCLEEAGLTPRTGDNDWGTEQELDFPRDGSSAAQEESVRLATIEARCSQETGMAQKLGDLEASYQAPLIKKNQGALNSIKEEIAEGRQKLADYLAANQ